MSAIKSIIVGSEGQDGRLLYQLLEKKGQRVIGVSKNSIHGDEGWSGKKIDNVDHSQVARFVYDVRPDHIYYLAAYHGSSEDDHEDEVGLLKKSIDTNLIGLQSFLEAIRLYSSSTKLFYASSSHVFGDPEHCPQNEQTPIYPRNIYGITKSAGMYLCDYYREKYNLWVSSGILYNHESKYRRDKFVSMKIINGAKKIYQGKSDSLELNDLDAEVDWGYAPDYVRAMFDIMRLDQAEDFVIATGKKHTVREFVRYAFEAYELDYSKFVKENIRSENKAGITLVGNSDKLRKLTGWKPSVDFKTMIVEIVNDIKYVENGR